MSRPDVTPMVNYAAGPAALDWLCAAFGFIEVSRLIGSDGLLAHAELRAGNGRIFVASVPGYLGPGRLRERFPEAQPWSALPWTVDAVLVQVADVDAHCARARAAGALILSEPKDQPPGRLYRCEDLEGHRWMFLQPPA